MLGRGQSVLFLFLLPSTDYSCLEQLCFGVRRNGGAVLVPPPAEDFYYVCFHLFSLWVHLRGVNDSYNPGNQSLLIP